ncbi:MAG: SAM-dependent methyltransferase [Flavisolibacter sp.]|nr:SAM-dependent methyltransferase [Flavisolibacter sp.]
MKSLVYLVPTVLMEGRTECLPAYLADAVKNSAAFFVEDERTARRYLKLLWKEMVIDNYEWWNMKEISGETSGAFRRLLKAGKTVSIISEAGCPGIADPGQQLVTIAQEMQVVVKPLVGPNSILLALMASGMNGQHFEFLGYLPIEKTERTKAITAIENASRQKKTTQIFIETPYRNNHVMEALVKHCHPQTRICVAVDLTGENEMVQTRTAVQWKNNLPELHKRPAIFLIEAT